MIFVFFVALPLLMLKRGEEAGGVVVDRVEEVAVAAEGIPIGDALLDCDGFFCVHAASFA